MIKFTGEKYDEERALYGISNAKVINCSFEGPADGESALKEASGLDIKDCKFLLRYPLWHVTDAKIENCEMTDTCRAAMWYDKALYINASVMGGIKALRECEDIKITNSKINSTEFGWFCKNADIKSSEMVSEYPFLKSEHMSFENFEMTAKYSFQYTKNIVIKNSVLNTKDAFWHGENIEVYDSVINGEYLGWYSNSLKLVRCKISGTQPLCYAKNLVLEDCEMIDCDLSFENSDVRASITGSITSVKNPKSGYIKAGSIGEIIIDNADSRCEIAVDN